MHDICTDCQTQLTECVAAQVAATADWHEAVPDSLDDVMRYSPAGSDSLLSLVLAQHFMNYSLWHVEDTARRKDVDAQLIADCKYAIDGFNQRRNDYMEKIDACLVQRLMPCIPPLAANQRPSYNTESLGMAVDRLSILALKIYHMHEQTLRGDVDAAHIAGCSAKLATLREQRADLLQSVCELMAAYSTGAKYPKAYYQFKMYNDPMLNPELYGKK